MRKVKHYHVKNKWLINSALRPFGMNVFSTFNTRSPHIQALHSIVKAIESNEAVIIPRGLGIIEMYEECYGPETHDDGMVDRTHPIYQYVYSN